MTNKIFVTIFCLAFPATGNAQADASDAAATTSETATTTEEIAAEQTHPERKGSHRAGIMGWGTSVGLKVGGGFSQPFSPLGTALVGELELGVALPLALPAGRDLEIFVAGQYAQPGVDERAPEVDGRMGGDGAWGYDLSLQELIVTLGLRYHLPVGLPDWLSLYGAVGGRVYATRTVVNGDASNAFGETEETATDFGLLLAFGASFHVGPGDIVGELQWAWAGVDNYVLANTNAAALNIAVGYRLYL